MFEFFKPKFLPKSPRQIVHAPPKLVLVVPIGELKAGNRGVQLYTAQLVNMSSQFDKVDAEFDSHIGFPSSLRVFSENCSLMSYSENGLSHRG